VNRIQGLREKQPLHHLAPVEKKQIYRTTDDANQRGQQEMESLFPEDNFLTPIQHGLPVVAEIIPPPGQIKSDKGRQHSRNLALKPGFDQRGMIKKNPASPAKTLGSDNKGKNKPPHSSSSPMAKYRLNDLSRAGF
jgi:hypothetical protein